MLIQSPPILFAFGMPGGMEWICCLLPFVALTAIIMLAIKLRDE